MLLNTLKKLPHNILFNKPLSLFSSSMSLQQDEAKAHWNSKASTYKDSYETLTLAPAITLANMLEIQKSQDIIEVACATGIFTLHLLRNLTNTKTFTSVDISDQMIELAKARKAATEGINHDIKHEFFVGDAENMSFIQDEAVDVYVSSMCIHMVPDESKFLQEAKRILKKGGRIGLTVPSKENGLMGLFLKNFEDNGWKSPFPKDYNALGYRDVMIKLLQDNGFEVRFCWEDHMKLPYYEDSDIDNQLTNGPLGGIFGGFDQDNQKKIRDNVMKEFHEIKKQFIPFQMKTVAIVAQKPL